ncbi:MAG: GldG family protein [Desulfamplus sp.]|nr:GldG family protein [Desulfamplus sp.]
MNAVENKKEFKDKNSSITKGGKVKEFNNKGVWFKFLIYMVVLVLVNIAGVTLFFRADLTSNKIYSISDASHNVVSTLSEPLTIKVFFTKNLPAPHNNTERYLHDLLEEYSAQAGKLFNYKFYDVTATEAGVTEQANVNRDMAEDYGISPVQIRVIENDEVKFQQAYMGLVIIHGDMIEKIPAITSTDGLEYTLTSSIQKLNNKVSALLALDDKIKITLYLSSSLEKVAPLMGLDELSTMPKQIEKVVEKLNVRSLDKIEYKYVDPVSTISDPANNEGIVGANNSLENLSKQYDIMVMKWPAIPQKGISAGEGCAGIVMEYKDKAKTTQLISSINIPIIGTTYQMVEPESLEEMFTETMETMIGINENIGYLADHGTHTIMDSNMAMMMQGQQQSSMTAFNKLVSERYSIQNVNLKDTDNSSSPAKAAAPSTNASSGISAIPEGLKTLIIARPTEPFSDYELFQIDQALMKGTNIAFFMDTFNEIMPTQQMPFGGGPQYLPINTGLEKLLNHYGVKIDNSYILDDNCYKQQKSPNQGGGEQKIYFAPIIKDANINNAPPYMNNIKGIIAMKISPLELDEKQLEQNGVKASKLFSSSEKSWLMEGNMNLNPMFMSPPSDASKMKSYPLAYILNGEFTSYFAGKPIPQKETKDDDDKNADDKGIGDNQGADITNKPINTPENKGEINESNTDDMKKRILVQNKDEIAKIEVKNSIITKGKPAKIFVMACSSMLQDNMLDPEGRSTNANFILNIIDHLNDRDDVAIMRSKNQTLNPLDETSPVARTFIKVFNIAGLPILVILFGFGVWARRASRRKTIKLQFQK